MPGRFVDPRRTVITKKIRLNLAADGGAIVDEPTGESMPARALITRVIVALSESAWATATRCPLWHGLKCGGGYIMRTDKLWNSNQVDLNFAETQGADFSGQIYNDGGGDTSNMTQPCNSGGGPITYSVGAGGPNDWDVDAIVDVYIEYIELPE